LKHVLLAAALLCAPVGHSAWGADPTATFPDRVIRVTDQTRYVNVMRFETIRFLISDAQGQERSFDWRFDQFEKRAFPLSDIAPGGLLGNRTVQVYIQRDPPSD
jgi:hypothetical protein